MSAIKTSALLPTKKIKKTIFYKKLWQIESIWKTSLCDFFPLDAVSVYTHLDAPVSHATTTVQPKRREGGGTSITAEGEEKEIATPCCFTSLAKEMQLEGGRCRADVNLANRNCRSIWRQHPQSIWRIFFVKAVNMLNPSEYSMR